MQGGIVHVRIHIISTHDGVDNPFNELITDIRAGKKPYSIHRITFDEAVSDGLYRRICLRLGKEWAKEGEEAWCKEIRDFYTLSAFAPARCVLAALDYQHAALRHNGRALRDGKFNRGTA